MSLYLLRDAGIEPIGATRSLRAPIGRLSCGDGHWDAPRTLPDEPPPHRRFRRFGPRHRLLCPCRVRPADPEHPCDFLTIADQKLAKRDSEHLPPRILAVILAFALVALLTQAGW